MKRTYENKFYPTIFMTLLDMLCNLKTSFQTIVTQTQNNSKVVKAFFVSFRCQILNKPKDNYFIRDVFYSDILGNESVSKSKKTHWYE